MMRRTHGFAIVELPIVLVVAAVLGLAIAGAIRLYAGGLAWYYWLAGALIPPLLVLALGTLLVWFDKPHSKVVQSNYKKDRK